MLKNIFDTQIQTERLLLRRLSLSDVGDMFEYTSNPEVTTYLHWHPHDDVSQTEVFIGKAILKYEESNTEFVYGLVLRTENKLIGALKVSNISYYNKRCEFTSILNPAYQGKGYMAEAWQALLYFCFEKAGMNRVQSFVTSDNIMSQKKNIRAGLSFEGKLKEYWVMKGNFKDALVYAITYEEYQRNQRSKNQQ